MLLTEYTEKAELTAKYPPEKGVEHNGFGLLSEIGELYEKIQLEHFEEVVPEAGDVLWNLAMSLKVAGYRPPAPIDLAAIEAVRSEGVLTIADLDVALLVIRGTYFAGRLAKRIRDGHDAVPDQVIWDVLLSLLPPLANILAAVGSTLGEAARANNDKLADRLIRDMIGGDGDHR